MHLTIREFLAVCLSFFGLTCCCAQSIKPGLAGMAPSKWITLKNTHAPGKTYRFPGTGNKTFTQEEFYVRAWIPVLKTEKITVILGPNYRTERLEFKSSGENPVSEMAGWNLRTYGLDLNSLIKLDSSSWLVLTSHVNKSGNFSQLPASSIPFNYTVSASFIRKKSAQKEVGLGLMMNKSYKFTFLPVLLFNYNYSSRGGIELLLPKRVAWRNNVSASDIIYLRAEAVARTYYISALSSHEPAVCRRLDLEMGVLYNRKLGKYAGFELFGGYRQNLRNKLIDGAIPVRTSGLVATVELYVQPPRFKKSK